MDKRSAKEHYERIILLRVQLFLRAVAFGGTLLIISKLHAAEKLLEQLGLQNNYHAMLAIAFVFSAAAATADIPIRHIIKKA